MVNAQRPVKAESAEAKEVKARLRRREEESERIIIGAE
jgi:hypothetical protein